MLLSAQEGSVLYVDPSFHGGEYSDKADYILIT